MIRAIDAMLPVLFVASAFLFALGFGAMHTRDGAARFGKEVSLDATEKSCGTIHSGSKVPVKFRLTNKSVRQVCIMGISNICMYQACFEAEGLPLAVPPGESRDINIWTTAGRTGEFSVKLSVFSDCDEKPVIPVKISGRVEPPVKSDHAAGL